MRAADSCTHGDAPCAPPPQPGPPQQHCRQSPAEGCLGSISDVGNTSNSHDSHLRKLVIRNLQHLLSMLHFLPSILILHDRQSSAPCAGHCKLGPAPGRHARIHHCQKLASRPRPTNPPSGTGRSFNLGTGFIFIGFPNSKDHTNQHAGHQEQETCERPGSC